MANSGDKTSSSCRYLRPDFHNSFPYFFILFFFILNSKMSRNIRKLCHKVCNSQNLPHESPNFRNYFFTSNFMDNLGHFSTILRPHYKNSFSKIFLFCFLHQAPGCLRTCVFGVTNCVMHNRAPVQLLHGQMKLDVHIDIPNIRKWK